MKSAGSRQLALAFADSPTGGRDRGTQDESRGKRYLLHTAKVNNRKDPATSTAAAISERTMESVALAHNLAQALLNVGKDAIAHPCLPRLPPRRACDNPTTTLSIANRTASEQADSRPGSN